MPGIIQNQLILIKKEITMFKSDMKYIREDLKKILEYSSGIDASQNLYNYSVAVSHIKCCTTLHNPSNVIYFDTGSNMMKVNCFCYIPFHEIYHYNEMIHKCNIFCYRVTTGFNHGNGDVVDLMLFLFLITRKYFPRRLSSETS